MFYYQGHDAVDAASGYDALAIEHALLVADTMKNATAAAAAVA